MGGIKGKVDLKLYLKKLSYRPCGDIEDTGGYLNKQQLLLVPIDPECIAYQLLLHLQGD